MKKILIITLSIVAVTLGTAFDILSDNGKAGATGSPSETTCRNCHNTFSTAGTGSIALSSTIPIASGWRYTPGTTYTMTAKVKYVGRSLFGVGVEALTSAGANAGTIVVTNTTKTTTKNYTVGANSRTSLVHKLNGGASTDSALFTFNWTAPSTNIGNVTFWYAGVMADASTDEFGDYVANGNTIVYPASATGINEQTSTKTALSVFTLASDRKLQIRFNAEQNTNAELALYDLNGKEVSRLNAGKIHSGDNSLEMNLPQQIKNGVYIVVVRAGSQQLSTKAAILL